MIPSECLLLRLLVLLVDDVLLTRGHCLLHVLGVADELSQRVLVLAADVLRAPQTPVYLRQLARVGLSSCNQDKIHTRSLVYKGWLKGMETSLSPLCFELEQIRDHFII